MAQEYKHYNGADPTSVDVKERVHIERSYHGMRECSMSMGSSPRCCYDDLALALSDSRALAWSYLLLAKNQPFIRTSQRVLRKGFRMARLAILSQNEDVQGVCPSSQSHDRPVSRFKTPWKNLAFGVPLDAERSTTLTDNNHHHDAVSDLAYSQRKHRSSLRQESDTTAT